MSRPRVLLAAPNVDGTDVGEAFVAYKWAEALSERVDLTVVAFDRPGRPAVAEQLPRARVVTLAEPRLFLAYERFNAMAKPGWPLFAAFARRVLAAGHASGARFDVAHRLMPNAARHGSPFGRTDVPVVVGPVGGSVPTPLAFRSESTAPAFTKLRSLDGLRFRHDPLLRAGYRSAALVLGVAPYVADLLAPIRIRRFETMLEIGVDRLGPPVARAPGDGRLRLVHVGRGVRTKGLRDAIRALARLRQFPGITLTAAGDGEDIAHCRREAEALGVADRVTFLGAVPRAAVEALYRTADVFLFPSWREPAGGVLLEAMRWGLPVIAADNGGPAAIVDAGSGLKVPVTTPDRFADGLADAIRRLAEAPDLRRTLAAGARRRVEEVGLWSAKAERMGLLYEEAASVRQVVHPAARRPSLPRAVPSPFG